MNTASPPLTGLQQLLRKPAESAAQLPSENELKSRLGGDFAGIFALSQVTGVVSSEPEQAMAQGTAEQSGRFSMVPQAESGPPGVGEITVAGGTESPLSGARSGSDLPPGAALISTIPTQSGSAAGVESTRNGASANREPLSIAGLQAQGPRQAHKLTPDGRVGANPFKAAAATDTSNTQRNPDNANPILGLTTASANEFSPRVEGHSAAHGLQLGRDLRSVENKAGLSSGAQSGARESLSERSGLSGLKVGPSTLAAAQDLPVQTATTVSADSQSKDRPSQENPAIVNPPDGTIKRETEFGRPVPPGQVILNFQSQQAVRSVEHKHGVIGTQALINDTIPLSKNHGTAQLIDTDFPLQPRPDGQPGNSSQAHAVTDNATPLFNGMAQLFSSKVATAGKTTVAGFDQTTTRVLGTSDAAIISTSDDAKTATVEDIALSPQQLAATQNSIAPRVVSANSFASLQFGDASFQRNFNDHILLMAGQGIQKAQLSLHPQELGTVEVRLALQNDEVSIQLASNSAVVRDVLEQALPRLRDLFEQAGLKLTEHEIANQFSDQAAHRHFDQTPDERNLLSTPPHEQLVATEIFTTQTRDGLIDTYI